MGQKVGGIDVQNVLVNAELRIARLEKIIDHLLHKMPPGTISQAEIDKMAKESKIEIQRKYQYAGITWGKPKE